MLVTLLGGIELMPDPPELGQASETQGIYYYSYITILKYAQ